MTSTVDSASGSSVRTDEAVEVFEDYLSQVLGGGHADFDAVCIAHPELESKLRELEADWQALSPLGAARAEEREHKKRGAETKRKKRYGRRETIGRGGMGEVMRVWDGEMRRNLAMKIARTPSHRVNAASLARFFEEAQLTGRLDHPGIVPVHELGLDADGRAYFTMRLVRGQDLQKVFGLARTGRESWNQQRALGVILKVCEAMAYAHSRNVIHRDLKPANVMVGRFGEVYVMDWGLAKVLGRKGRERDASEPRPKSMKKGGSPISTIDGTVIGTPSYMPPEQARGALDEIGPHSDVYAVGAMLYTLLTGRVPYVPPGQRLSQETVLAKVLKGPPIPVRRLSRTVPEELVAICETAMARNPARRYPSMVEMAEDLRAYLEGHVVQAYETGAYAEFRKWVARNRLAAGAILASIVAVVVGLASIAVVLASSKKQIEESNVGLQAAIGESERARAEAVAAQAALEAANTELLATVEELREARDEAARNAESALEQKERADETAALLRQEAATSGELFDFVLGLFRLPAGSSGATITAKEILDAGAEEARTKLDVEPDLRTRLLEVLGTTYLSLGQYAEAGEVLAEALELERAEHGRASVDTIEGLYSVGLRLADEGRTSEAAELFEHLCEAFEETLGPDSGVTLQCAASLARVYIDAGRYDEAGSMLPRIVKGLRAARGDEDPATLAAITNLGYLHEEQKSYWEAEPLFEEVLETSRRILGNGARDTLRAMNNLARLQAKRGLLMDAEDLYREAYDGQRKHLGAGDPDTLNSLDGLARVTEDLHAPHVVVELYLQILAKSRNELGEGHPAVLHAKHGLAITYVRQKRYEDAHPLVVDLVELTPESDPDYDPLVALLESLENALDRR